MTSSEKRPPHSEHSIFSLVSITAEMGHEAFTIMSFQGDEKMASMRKGLLAGFLFIWMAGCAPLVFFGAGSAAGIAGYKYYRGALTVLYRAPYIETWDASLSTLHAMNLKIEHQEHDVTSGEIKAKRADKRMVRLSITYKDARETEVVIRVGIFGDQAASLRMKDEIGKALFGE